ncbi:MAG: LTA synthase family protein [Eubacteriales bacterium]
MDKKKIEVLKRKINSVKEWKYNYLLLILFHIGFITTLVVKVFYFQYTSRINNLPFNQLINYKMLITSTLSILIIYSILNLISFNKTMTVLIIVNALVSILLFIDTLYARYYSTPLDINVIINQIQYIGDIKSSGFSLIRFKDIIYFIDIPIMAAFMVFIVKPKKINWIRKISVSVFLLIASILAFNFVYSKANSGMEIYDKKYVVKEFGVLYYHYNDVKNYVKSNTSNQPATEEELERIRAQFFRQKDNEYTGIAKDKNLLIIQLEAMQEFIIGREIEGREITPNINKFIEESIYFDNMYNQVGGGNTSDAEMLMNNSLFGTTAGSAFFTFANNEYYSLPKRLKEKGYSTMAFHGNDPTFWNRQQMYRSLGFDSFYSIDDYEPTDWWGWGIEEKEFIPQSIDFIEEEAGDDPFYGFLVAMSLHHPYNVFRNQPFEVGKYEGTMLGDFIKGANYIDIVIGDFIEDLKERGLYEDTIIVMYGDHSALFQDQATDLCDFLDIEYNSFNWEKIQKVMALIHIPELENGVLVNEPAGEIDLLPTVANLMDLDMPYMLGRDLLGSEEPYVVRRDGTVIAEEFIYLVSTNEVYDINTGELLPFEGYKDRIYNFQEQLRVSDLILGRDALKSID